ncbi:MAG: hypothetical protein H6878_06410 [Rhodobiaceae bacterium]|nr:hypothetical protein [Rhodobiaceae bacterium]MCC0040711.1 hypothetical protein [Rhodobiaceae bacterium]
MKRFGETWSLRALRVFAAGCALAAMTVGADAGGAVSDWVAGGYSRVRLVNAGARDDGTWVAGLEIDLEHGWKTYWRSPGETGVPPVFDWAASRNLADAAVAWPAPVRFVDSGLESIGYKGDVILPLIVRPADDGGAPVLDLVLFYAVCAEICVPEEARLSLDLGQPTAPRTRLAVEAALSRVPRPSAAGETVRAAMAGSDRETPMTLRIASRGGETPSAVFVEGPENWYLPAPVAADGSTTDETVYSVPLSGIPADAAIDGAGLTVTVVYPSAAFEESLAIRAR